MDSSVNKKKKNKKNKNNNKKSQPHQIPMITDERFAPAMNDPRFMQAPKKRSKVEIDSRFKQAFTDRKFASSKAPVDKRGKRRSEKDKSKSSLSHYYRLEEDEVKKKVIGEEDDESEGDSESGSDSEKLKLKLKTEVEDELESVDEMSGTDTGTDTDSAFSEEEEEEEAVPEIEKETRRLAVVNLDWTEVRAADIYAVLHSFLRKRGQIISVAVYPSEFGIKRMEEEAMKGPVGLFDDEKEKEDEDEDDDDEIDSKKIRAYELSRLRYYYAVVECDSVTTADFLYKSCDGIEFERSANILDLRFIPDSMEFKHQPRDVATEKPAGYDGLDFQTRALQHSNIHISWDEDGPQRSRTLKRLLKSDQPADSDLNEFLATDESETDDDDGLDEDGDDNADDEEIRSPKKRKRQNKYLALLKSGDGSDEDDEEDNGQDMEVTFNSGLEDLSKRILEKKDDKSETVWAATLRKRREKKKARKNRSKYSSDDESDIDDSDREQQPDDFFVEEEPSDKQVHSSKTEGLAKEAVASQAELELLLANDKGETRNLKGFNLKPKKKNGKKGKENLDEKLPTIDYSDPRFSAVMNNPNFALDPTDPQFKRSATYVRQLAEKEKKGDTGIAKDMDRSVISGVASEMPEGETVKHNTSAPRKENLELSLLVKSIKMKSKNLPSQSERKVRWNHKLKANIQK